MTKKILLIIGIVIVSGIAGGLVVMQQRPSVPAPAGSQPTGPGPAATTTGQAPVTPVLNGQRVVITAETKSWFEGWDSATFSVTVPETGYKETGNGWLEWGETTSGGEWRNVRLILTYEGGRGYSPADYYANKIAPECPNCQPVPGPAIPGMSEVLFYADGRIEHTVFRGAHSQYLFAATYPVTISEPARRTLTSFTWSESRDESLGEPMPVQIFLAKKGVSSEDCKSVFPVEHYVPKVPAVATAAINELLIGPTIREVDREYWSQIPSGSKLLSLKIENGTAYADFNRATEMGGGSCGQGVVTSQIRETLMQFPTVKKVVLSVEGESSPWLIFQP